MSDKLLALPQGMNFISPKEVSNGRRAVASVERWVLGRDLATSQMHMSVALARDRI